jgi:hypothetical protein
VKKEFIVNRQGRDFVLYAGLLDQAHREGLKRITTTLLQPPTDENGQLAIVYAEVETEKGTFSGIGDANPSNVGRMVAVHLTRLAETRAKARALRDAINVGVSALEELADAEDLGEQASKATGRQLVGVARTRSDAPAAGTRANRQADATGNAAVVERRTSGTGPATTQQIDRLLKLQAALGRPTQALDGLSFEEAAHQITDLVCTFNAQARGGRPNART